MGMNRTFRIVVFIVAALGLFLWPLRSVYADYMLPYPSFMPGNKIYTLSRIWDKLNGYWYFGSIAQTKHHLALADKYLVEAKTLFEYKQYLLAADALARSDREFKSIEPSIATAVKEGKDVEKLRSTLREAAAEHIAVLTRLKQTLPESFNWSPEKKPATELFIWRLLNDSTSIRAGNNKQ